MPESSQPFTKYLAKAEVLVVNVGLQSQLIESAVALIERGSALVQRDSCR